MGAGTGILGMMAARAGATQVIGVEQNGHMADIGEECMVRCPLVMPRFSLPLRE